MDNRADRLARQKAAVRSAKRKTRGIKALNPFLAKPHNEALTASLRFENLGHLFFLNYLLEGRSLPDYGAAFLTREGASMKVLFLDIDGVLNRFGDEDGNGRTTKLIDDFFIGLDAALLQIYKAMLSRISVTVVLSSTWRHWQPMLDHLKENGVEFSYMTPSLRDPHLVRGHEIQAWLMEHPEVTKYAILDDDTEMLEHQLPNFFQPMTETGITQELADRIVAHLDG